MVKLTHNGKEIELTFNHDVVEVFGVSDERLDEIEASINTDGVTKKTMFIEAVAEACDTLEEFISVLAVMV